MPLLLDILSWIFLVSGSFFVIVGGIGIMRLPDFYARLHGAGITDTLGAGLLIIGLMFQSIKAGLQHGPELGPWLITVKLVMIILFLLVTSPTACHALAQAAMTDGLEPQVADEDEEETT